MPEHHLIDVFAGRKPVSAMSMAELDLLVRQARRSDVLAKLCLFLQESRQFEDLPEAIRWHFTAPLTAAKRHAVLVRFEIGQIEQALGGLDVPVVILKGAAYTLAELPAAEGRLFADIDIMVPKLHLDKVEAELTQDGWLDGEISEYDQKYYRKWMHELPPKQHQERETILDVHHAILPETARIHPDSKQLFAAAVPLSGHENLFVLAPEDMLLHSMVHLFHDGEFEHGLRDLLDLQGLLSHFAEDDGFWDRLLARASELELGRPLYYALYYVRWLLNAPVPDRVLETSGAQGAPGWPLRPLMHVLFDSGLLPKHQSCRTALSGVYDWMLYVRSHYLRMPPKLLIPHLFHKAVISRWHERQEAKRAANRPTMQDFLNQRMQ